MPAELHTSSTDVLAISSDKPITDMFHIEFRHILKKGQMMSPPTIGELSDAIVSPSPWNSASPGSTGPWEPSGVVPASLAPEAERPLARLLWKRLLNDGLVRYQLIIGPRQVGKTTVLYQTVRHLLASGIDPGSVWFLRLDHPALMNEPLDELVETLIFISNATEDSPVYLMLDDLTFADDWDRSLPTFHDKRRPVRIAASSNAAADLLKRSRRSGVGLWEEQHLGPYQLSEWAELAGVTAEVETSDCLAETLRELPRGAVSSPQLGRLRSFLSVIGGFPELLTRAVAAQVEESFDVQVLLAQRALRDDLIERAIYRDLPQEHPINDPPLVDRLLCLLAERNGHILSPSNLATELGVTATTVEKYVKYLESACLVFTLPTYAGSEPAKQRRGRKLYFADCALSDAMLLRVPDPYKQNETTGHRIENLAASALRTLAEQSEVSLYCWRDRQQREVDFVYDDPNGRVAFEIASSSRHDRRGLHALLETHPEFRGNAYLVAPDCVVTHSREVKDGVGTLPLDTFLLAVGAQSDAAMAKRLGALSRG